MANDETALEDAGSYARVLVAPTLLTKSQNHELIKLGIFSKSADWESKDGEQRRMPRSGVECK